MLLKSLMSFFACQNSINVCQNKKTMFILLCELIVSCVINFNSTQLI